MPKLEKERKRTTRKALWRELLWRKPIGYLAIIVLFASTADWLWDETIALRFHVERPKLFDLLHWLPWYGWTIIGLIVSILWIGEHAYNLIHSAEDKLEAAEETLQAARAAGKTTLNRDLPGDWRLMEDGFRRHSRSSVRATWQRSSYGTIENWTVHGDHQQIVREVEVFCIQSGKLLTISPMSPPVSAQLLSEPSDLNRWLYFLKDKHLLSDVVTGSETVDGKTYAVTIGEVNSLAMVSASACVECASMAFTS